MVGNQVSPKSLRPQAIRNSLPVNSLGNIRANEEFSSDVRGAGKSLLFAAVPRLLESSNRRRLDSILSKPRSPTNVKEALEDLFDLEGHDEFLTLVSNAVCEQSRRLTMKELYSKLRNFNGDDLPFIT